MALTNLYKKMLVGVLKELPKDQLIKIIAEAVDRDLISDEEIDSIVEDCLRSRDLDSAIDAYVNELFNKSEGDDHDSEK